MGQKPRAIANDSTSRSKQSARKALLLDLFPAVAGSTKEDDGDGALLALPAAELAARVRSGALTADAPVRAYARAAARAHAATNCLTEVLAAEAVDGAGRAERARGQGDDPPALSGGLAGVPVSLKDTICVAGYDASAGYSAWTGEPEVRDAAIVRILRDAGAVPFVKTNVPITLLSFESSNDVSARPLAQVSD
jgi:Asp-tRNA(Asn)/Glu-tRNA(Gln) amidotransferase A subunit family amidase